MSRYAFDPVSRELKYANPSGAEIPESAYALNSSYVYVQQTKRTSPFLIAMVVTVLILVIIAMVYLGWLLFIRTADQPPSAFFSWITGR